MHEERLLGCPGAEAEWGPRAHRQVSPRLQRAGKWPGGTAPPAAPDGHVSTGTAQTWPSVAASLVWSMMRGENCPLFPLHFSLQAWRPHHHREIFAEKWEGPAASMGGGGPPGRPVLPEAREAARAWERRGLEPAPCVEGAAGLDRMPALVTQRTELDHMGLSWAWTQDGSVATTGAGRPQSIWLEPPHLHSLHCPQVWGQEKDKTPGMTHWTGQWGS